MGISARTRVLVVGFAMALVAACSGGYDSTTAPGGNNGGGNNTGGNNGPAVNISGFAFAPAADTVTAGTTVTWTNKDAATHTVTADDATFDSGNVGNGATYTHTFSAVGTYAYHCAIHAGMNGKIIVK